MKVIWIDPGETVGWVTANVHPAVLRQDRGPRLDVVSYDNTKLKTFAMTFLEAAVRYDVVGIESYSIRPDKLLAHAGSDVPTLQLIGMLRLACWQAQKINCNGAPAIVFQPPQAQSKGAGAAKLVLDVTSQAAILDAEGGKHDDGHYGSALKHLAAWYYDAYVA